MYTHFQQGNLISFQRYTDQWEWLCQLSVKYAWKCLEIGLEILHKISFQYTQGYSMVRIACLNSAFSGIFSSRYQLIWLISRLKVSYMYVNIQKVYFWQKALEVDGLNINMSKKTFTKISHLWTIICFSLIVRYQSLCILTESTFITSPWSLFVDWIAGLPLCHRTWSSEQSASANSYQTWRVHNTT